MSYMLLFQGEMRGKITMQTVTRLRVCRSVRMYKAAPHSVVIYPIVVKEFHSKPQMTIRHWDAVCCLDTTNVWCQSIRLIFRYFTVESFDLLVALNVKSGENQSIQDSSSGEHEYLYYTGIHRAMLLAKNPGCWCNTFKNVWMNVRVVDYSQSSFSEDLEWVRDFECNMNEREVGVRCLNGSQVCQRIFLDGSGRGSGNTAIRGDLLDPWLLCLCRRKHSCYVRPGGLWLQSVWSPLVSYQW